MNIGTTICEGESLALLPHNNIIDINFWRIKFKHDVDRFEGFKIIRSSTRISS